MASPLELLGINPQTGLGGIVTGMNTQEAFDLDQQQGLQKLFNAQQQRQLNEVQMQKDLLGLDTARQTQASDIAAANAGNEAKVGAAGLAKMQQFGERVTQLGGAMKQMPVEQRQAYLQNLAQQVPGIAKDPTFMALMNTDPNMLPQELEKTGRNIMLQTGEQMRASALTQQKDDAAMAREQAGNAAALERTRISEAGANGRAAMSESRAMQLARFNAETQKDLRRMDIDAGKYASKKAGTDPATMLMKAGTYEKTASLYQVLANQTKDPEEKAEYQAYADDFYRRRNEDQIARVAPGMTVGPDGNVMPNLPMGARGVAPVPMQQSAPTQAAPQGVEQAVKAAGWSYEPQQYNYRIDPNTGRAQRQKRN